MGEIKSTLDIVMEKTKHLSMSHEEKQEKEKEDVRSAVKGLVQKYQDQILRLEMFKKELDDLHQRHSFEDKDVLLDDVFSRLDLASDNSRFFDLIETIFNMDHVKIREIQRQYMDEFKKSSDSRTEEIRNELNEKYSVSGSAVIPNIEADPSLKEALDDMKGWFHSDLDRVKSELAKM